MSTIDIRMYRFISHELGYAECVEYMNCIVISDGNSEGNSKRGVILSNVFHRIPSNIIFCLPVMNAGSSCAKILK